MISATWRFPPKNRDIAVIVPGTGTAKCLKLHDGLGYACIEDIMATNRTNHPSKTAPKGATPAEIKAAGRRARRAASKASKASKVASFEC